MTTETSNNTVRLGDVPIFSTSSVPGQVIEGLIGEKITEIYKSVEVLNNGDELEKLKPMDLRNCKATIAVAKLELNELFLCLADMKDKSLNPRHRLVKRMSHLLLKKIDEVADEIQSAQTPDDPSIISGVKNILQFLEDAVLLMADKKSKVVVALTKEYKDDFTNYQI